MHQSIIALLFVSGEGMPISQLATLLNIKEDEIKNSLDEVKNILEKTGLTLIIANNQISITTKGEFGELIDSFRKEELKGDLTPATLQVLTLVAYLDNPSRRDISFIRGVQSAQSIRTLTVRGLIERNGENCSLTIDALRFLGISKVMELPEYENIKKELEEKLKSAYKENI